MFQKLASFLIVFFVVVLELAVLPNFFPSGTIPNLTLILIIFWTIWQGFEKALPKTIMVGLFLDLVLGWPTGVNIITYVILSFGVSFVTKRFLISYKAWQFFIIAMLVVLSTIANDLILLALGKIVSIFSLHKDWVLSMPGIDTKIFLKSIFNVAAFLILYWPLVKMESILEMYIRRVAGDKSFQKR